MIPVPVQLASLSFFQLHISTRSIPYRFSRGTWRINMSLPAAPNACAATRAIEIEDSFDEHL
jgi:hypothetical protein